MLSLGECLEGFIRYLVGKNASRHTIDKYSREVGEFVNFLEREGIRYPLQIERQALRRYGLWLGSSERAQASKCRRAYEVRSFLRYLWKEEVIKGDIRELVIAPKMPRRLPRFLEPHEVEALLEAPPRDTPLGQRDRAILEILYASGIRLSELVGLELGEVNTSRGEMMVMGKGRKERIVLLGKPALEALGRYLKDGRPRLLGRQRSEGLFLNRFGGRLSARAVKLILDRCARKAGMTKKVTPHLLRHTFATHMLGGGADLRVVQDLLGHEELKSTQVYAHVSQRRAREVYLKSHPLAKESR